MSSIEVQSILAVTQSSNRGMVIEQLAGDATLVILCTISKGKSYVDGIAYSEIGRLDWSCIGW